jgi:trehalose 6-phosphate synthase/phosphatase
MKAAQQRELEATLRAMRTCPVFLNRSEVRGYYEVVCNGILWPLFHYLSETIPIELDGWESYRAVNAKFADSVARIHEAGDTVWVHDFHLALLPAMLRERIPDARIGFFLHVPFPSTAVFAILPWRNELLEGLLGADLVGFHTSSYVREFIGAVRLILGADARYDGISLDGREVKFGAFPMGIDVQRWAGYAVDDEVRVRAEEMREGADHIFVGIDRLDYTKGIHRRLLAFERLLEEHEELHGRTRFIQLTVPSREKVDAYAGLRRRIDETVGRINSRYTTPTNVPIHRIHQSLPERDVAALYRAADVMLVTPLRDGMNLVAKEFVASRAGRDGVLVLSEFAGAASELGDALHVNPYDIAEVARTMFGALMLEPEERRQRMDRLYAQVARCDTARWADGFLSVLQSTPTRRYGSVGNLGGLMRALRGAQDKPTILALDYDGTLVPFRARPEDASPQQELRELLGRLSARPNTHVFVVSGRSKESLELWLGDVPIEIQAEHGLWRRPADGRQWERYADFPLDWKHRVRTVFEQFCQTTHGSFVEDKTASIAWHYRCATGDHVDGLDFGEYQARELRMVLSDLLRDEPLQVLLGNKVLEVRPAGLSKGIGAVHILAKSREPGTLILAIGDDETDEDLFAALPSGSITVRVGSAPTQALYRVESQEDVRRVLGLLVE